MIRVISNTIKAMTVLGLLLSFSVSAKEDFPEVTEDGLRKVADSELNLVYVAEGVDFSVYNRVWLVDAGVSFEKNWQRDQNRSYSHKVSAKDMERIKAELAELFNEVFTEKLQEAGHDLTNEVADDVLIVRPAIVNLNVKAPDTRNVGRGYQLTESAGDMTLYVELYDSATGAIIAKAMDLKADRSRGSFQWQTKGSNRVAAKRALGDWADTLVTALSSAQDSSNSDNED